MRSWILPRSLTQAPGWGYDGRPVTIMVTGGADVIDNMPGPDVRTKGSGFSDEGRFATVVVEPGACLVPSGPMNVDTIKPKGIAT